jgi:NADH-quinone oxidoreductase subunit H
MISYELGLSLSLLGTLMVYGTLNFNEMIQIQSTNLSFTYFGEIISVSFLPNWGIFYQPLGALLFLVCVFAECNRLPFDLPEAESELVAGYHTEYGGLKMLMFYIGEYGHMIVGASLTVVMFFGGYDLVVVGSEDVRSFLLNYNISDLSVSFLVSLFFLVGFLLKIFLLLWLFIWVRWTLPRFRYDQLMDLGWKKILPWGLFNSFVTAAILFAAHS